MLLDDINRLDILDLEGSCSLHSQAVYCEIAIYLEIIAALVYGYDDKDTIFSFERIFQSQGEEPWYCA